MSEADATLLIKISGGIILFLLGMVGFFIKKQFTDQDESWEKRFHQLEIMVTKVAQSVDKLQSMFTILQTEQGERDPRTEERLNWQEKKINEYDAEIKVIKQRCFFIHSEKENQNKKL